MLSETAEFLYKTTDYYSPSSERAILWNDPTLAIEWPMPEGIALPSLSGKDQQAKPFFEAEVFA